MREIRKQQHDLQKMEWANTLARSRLELARKMTEDPEQDQRKQRQECVVCYSSKRVGGARTTQVECAYCDKVLTFASTSTDAMCIDCARERRLCKRCGADIELRNRRKI